MEYLEHKHIFNITNILNVFDTLEAMENDIADGVEMVATISYVNDIWHLSIKFKTKIIYNI